ncbi:response regulator [Nocardioides marmorisolisilvae]|uniref:Response regulator n=1 Tax=Nocardioides marmorisolisilvae TaxID=1542737 RepID=A0A3N0DSD5_9ACTN|nr:response regulator [Nocardioides marmorisolisilvae]RNL78529.1 response regulator [Nocardioides marmorisolisilvae]
MVSSRTATVLFTDLVGSTETIARVSAATADAIRARHFAKVRNVLAVHHGQEVKTLGDGFMAVFESAADGIACAVTLQRTMSRDREREEHALVMRIGLSAGEVTVEAGDYFGIPVIEASRLCGAAGGSQILCSELLRLLAGATSGIHQFTTLGHFDLKGLPAPLQVCEVGWDNEGDSALRVALADDSALLRQGIASVLEHEGFEIVLQVGDAESLLDSLSVIRPHVVIVDVRMPPTNTTEGLDAAARIRAEHPGTGILVLSAQVEAKAAARLLADGSDGIGYLLKDRVGDVSELAEAVRTVAQGGSAIDPDVVAELTG